MKRSLLATVVLVVGATILAVGLVGARLMQTGPQDVAHAAPPFQFAIDANPWNNANPCASIDASNSVDVGDDHQVAVCTVNEPRDAGGVNPDNVNVFGFTLTYNPLLNQCKTDPDCPAPPAGKCLDDNPDANAGSTLGSGVPTSPDLGTGWDCSCAGLTQPTCGGGTAVVNCLSTEGPYTSGGLSPFPLAIVSFTAIGEGVDTIIATAGLTGVWWEGVMTRGAGPTPGSVSAEVHNEGTPPPPTATQTATATATPTPDTGSGPVTKSAGGTVTSNDEDDGVSPSDPIDTTVSVLAESASQDTTITITEMSASDPSVHPAPSDLQVLGQVAVIETIPVATFSSYNPATLTITYDDSVAPADESTIEVSRFAGSEWVPLGEPCTGGGVGTPLNPDPCISARDTDANSITIKTTSLSDWALMGPLAPVGGVAEYPDIAESRLSAGGSSSLPYSALVGVAAAVGAIAAGAWYARRRWRAG